jgi:hypothetical protein
MTNHTPEPWTNPIPQTREDADRVLACVNACAGIDPSAVPAMVRALETMKEFLDDYTGKAFNTSTTSGALAASVMESRRAGAMAFLNEALALARGASVAKGGGK